MQPDSWDAEYNLGTALVAKGEVDEAIVHCDRAVAMQPNDPDGQVSLGDALLQKKRVDEAIVHYHKAMTLRPDYFLAYYGLGRALLEKGELNSAIQHCRAALFIRPDDADCHGSGCCSRSERRNGRSDSPLRESRADFPKIHFCFE
jgi:tetratricopeptide (TPR) repeat protein